MNTNTYTYNDYKTAMNLEEEFKAMDWMIKQFNNWHSTQDIGQLVITEYQEWATDQIRANKSPLTFVLWFNLFNKFEAFPEKGTNYDYKEYCQKQFNLLNEDTKWEWIMFS